MTTDRSLDSNFPGVQSFQVFLTGEFRNAFTRIYKTMTRETNPMDAMASSKRRQAGEGGNSNDLLNPDKQVRAWKELTVFLQEFVENNFGKVSLRRTIRDPTLYEEVFKYPVDLSRNFEEPSVFLTDKNLRYTKCLFLGREWELMLMNILAYTTFDMWLGSTAYSILLTWLLDWTFTYVRGTYGTAIITSKTLIDDRFLQ